MTRSPAARRITTSPPGPPSGSPPAAGALAGQVPVVLAVAAVLAQIAHPLLGGGVLRAATAGAVLLFAAASLAHATVTLGVGVAGQVLLVAGGLGWVVEAVGVTTGLPFGAYRYAGTLGPQVLGVPLLVPLAWTMMAYPCLLLGRRMAVRRDAAVVLGALTLAAWDLYLDPQMVADGHWTWLHPAPALPGVPGVPLTNYAGWAVAALVITGALDRTVPRPAPGTATRPGAPALLLGWTWLGSALGAAAFFHRPAVAAYGLPAMGATVLPYLLAVRHDVARGPR